MELIQIETSKDNKQYVKAKHLYNRLGLNLSEWSRWRTRNIENNEFFLENKDWHRFVITPNRGGKSEVDYNITIEFAKHLAMMAKTNKSHEIRNYFIECENKLSIKPELPDFTDPAEAAIAWAQQYKEKQQALALIEQQKPLVEFANIVQTSYALIDLKDMAKLISDNVITIGRNNLMKLLRDRGFLNLDNTPSQKSVNAGLMKAVEKTWVNSKTGNVELSVVANITTKGQVYFLNNVRKFLTKEEK